MEIRPQDQPVSSSAVLDFYTALLAVAASSIIFAAFFEWPRYHGLLNVPSGHVSLYEELILFWLLVAKSLLLMLPVVLLTWLVLSCRLKRVSLVLLVSGQTVVLSWLAIDLVLVSYSGAHVSSYLPYLSAMIQFPEEDHMQWVGSGVLLEISLLITGLAILGAIVVLGTRWGARKVLERFPWLQSRLALGWTVTAFLCIAISAVPTVALVRPDGVLSRFCAFLPVDTSALEFFGEWSLKVPNPVASNPLTAAQASLDRGDLTSPRRKGLPDPHGMKNKLLQLLGDEFANPQPEDTKAVVLGPRPPNVILILLESLQHSSISPDLTPRLYKWSEGGLRLEKHYSGANCSHYGIFSLLYGRIPIAYFKTLDRGIRPQLLTSLRSCGYCCSYLSCYNLRGFWRMWEILDEHNLDSIHISGGNASHDYKQWPDGDRQALAKARSMVTKSTDRPQFLFLFLMSTHYPYACPPEFEVDQPTKIGLRFMERKEDPESLRNRYRNSLRFMDSELMEFIEALDPERNVVIVTGDHGESIKDDGTVGHGTRPSEMQTRVPFVMVGGGIRPMRIQTPTSHLDLLPTLLHALAGRTVPVKTIHGRDLLETEDSGRDIIIRTFSNDRLVLHGGKRLLFWINPRGPESLDLRFKGFVDDRGDPTFGM